MNLDDLNTLVEVFLTRAFPEYRLDNFYFHIDRIINVRADMRVIRYIGSLVLEISRHQTEESMEIVNKIMQSVGMKKFKKRNGYWEYFENQNTRWRLGENLYVNTLSGKISNRSAMVI